MDDDFNTPEALAVMQALARDLNIARASNDTVVAEGFAAELRALGEVLGILAADPDEWLKTRVRGLDQSEADATARPPSEEIDALIAERTAARRARDFAASDRIRDLLQERGVLLEDSAAGTQWRYR
jgi:cysteinyl-tRNA synthetase